jgi:protein-S-isoprenylcysteine O-methyltransferase Ste14
LAEAMSFLLPIEGPQFSRDAIGRLWDRLPLPEHHAVAIPVGLLMQRLVPLRLPRRLRPIGWLLLAAGTVANAIAVHERGGGDLERPERIITGGLHGLTRNPMYVGWSSIHVGVGLLLSNGWILATWPITAALTHWWVVSVEERRLAEEFGEEYSRYQRRVPRYLGRVPG